MDYVTPLTVNDKRVLGYLHWMSRSIPRPEMQDYEHDFQLTFRRSCVALPVSINRFLGLNPRCQMVSEFYFSIRTIDEETDNYTCYVGIKYDQHIILHGREIQEINTRNFNVNYLTMLTILRYCVHMEATCPYRNARMRFTNIFVNFNGRRIRAPVGLNYQHELHRHQQRRFAVRADPKARVEWGQDLRVFINFTLPTHKPMILIDTDSEAERVVKRARYEADDDI